MTHSSCVNERLSLHCSRDQHSSVVITVLIAAIRELKSSSSAGNRTEKESKVWQGVRGEKIIGKEVDGGERVRKRRDGYENREGETDRQRERERQVERKTERKTETNKEGEGKRDCVLKVCPMFERDCCGRKTWSLFTEALVTQTTAKSNFYQ